MKVIFCKYDTSRRRLHAVIGENVILGFIFFLTIASTKKSEKIMKIISRYVIFFRFFGHLIRGEKNISKIHVFFY